MLGCTGRLVPRVSSAPECVLGVRGENSRPLLCVGASLVLALDSSGKALILGQQRTLPPEALMCVRFWVQGSMQQHWQGIPFLPKLLSGEPRLRGQKGPVLV